MKHLSIMVFVVFVILHMSILSYADGIILPDIDIDLETNFISGSGRTGDCLQLFFSVRNIADKEYNCTFYLAILKPDCIKRKLAGKVLARLEDEKFTILAAKLVQLSKHAAEGFYAVHKNRPFFYDLVEFMTSGLCMHIILQRDNAVEKLREVIGATDPLEAAPGTVRKEYAENKQNNIIHASDSIENAQIEIAYFFSGHEAIENSIKL